MSLHLWKPLDMVTALREFLMLSGELHRDNCGVNTLPSALRVQKGRWVQSGEVSGSFKDGPRKYAQSDWVEGREEGIPSGESV